MSSATTEKKRRTIQIAITERCNLNCVYCYEHRKDLRILSVEAAKKFLLREARNVDDFDEFEINFHGGEPMLAFPQIREIAEWVWGQKWPKPYICFATTNGTLVHGEIKEWFRANAKRFVLGLSLDGTKEMHDTNRSKSYDKIDFAFFRESWPFQGVKATVSPQSIHSFADGIKHILELGFPYSINLAYGMEWTEDLLPVYRRELKKVADFYLSRPELELPKLLSHIISKIGAESVKKQEERDIGKWCGTGSAMICLGPDEKIYPCQSFMPSTSVPDGDTVQTVLDFSKETIFRDPDCNDCLLESACPSCYGNNYTRTGTLYKRDKSLCKFRKVEAFAASYLFGMMLQEPEKYHIIAKKKDSEKLAIARGVKIVQDMFANEVEAY